MPRKPKPKAKKRQTRTIDKRGAFLAAYVASASLTAAAEAVGIDRALHYRWLQEPKYAADYAAARLQAGDTLKDDAVHWARVGIFEPLVFQGQFQFADYRVRTLCMLPDGSEVFAEDVPKGVTPTGERPVKVGIGPPLGVFRRSEGLMARLLKAQLPAEFGDKTAMELTGADGGPIDSSITVTFVKPKE